mgnify:CR=1 FL=1
MNTTIEPTPAKIKTIKLYTLDQLSDGAKKKAIRQFLDTRDEYFWQDENRNSLEKFAELFDIKLTSYFYGDRGEGVNYTSSYRSEVEELTGVRLATWIYNNIGKEIFTPKYYSVDLNKEVKHKRIKCEFYKRTGNYFVGYYSAITKENSCPLTGYCMDDKLLKPIYEFLKKPDNKVSLLDLLDDCFNEWVKAGNAEIDYQNSDEFAIQELEERGWLFTIDGTMTEVQ